MPLRLRKVVQNQRKQLVNDNNNIIFRNKKKKIILRKNHITQGQRRWSEEVCCGEECFYIRKIIEKM